MVKRKEGNWDPSYQGFLFLKGKLGSVKRKGWTVPRATTRMETSKKETLKSPF